MHQHEYFLAVATEESFSIAAEKLYISQPSLSKHISRLEGSLGVKLFKRNTRPIRLTEAGELYLNYVNQQILNKKRLLREINGINKVEVSVSFAITVWRSTIMVPIIIPIVNHLYPDITTQVLEGSHKYMIYQVKNNHIDFMICHQESILGEENLVFEHLFHERVLFCVNRLNPVLDELNIELDHTQIHTLTNEAFNLFKDQDFILLKREQHMRMLTQNFVDKLSLDPHILLETENIITAIKCVDQNLGVTFVPEHNNYPSSNLMYFQVDTPALQWEVGFAYNANSHPVTHVRHIMEDIRNAFQDNQQN